MPETYRDKEALILNDLNKLVSIAKDKGLILNEYQSIAKEHILKWFRSINNNANPNQYQQILNIFEENLIQQDQSDSNALYKMTNVEELQGIVYSTYLKHHVL